jgi:hypothetical protein
LPVEGEGEKWNLGKSDCGEEKQKDREGGRQNKKKAPICTFLCTESIR